MSILDSMPLYALRAYEKLWRSGSYVLIDTHRDTYVLDCPDLEGDYAARRLQLACMKLPYKLYKLNERFTTIPQLVNTTRKMLVDKDGNVIRYRKSKWLRVEYLKVIRCDRTWKGTYRIVTSLATDFVLPHTAEYIGYIRDGHALYLYEVCNELKKTRRIKI